MWTWRPLHGTPAEARLPGATEGREWRGSQEPWAWGFAPPRALGVPRSSQSPSRSREIPEPRPDPLSLSPPLGHTQADAQVRKCGSQQGSLESRGPLPRLPRWAPANVVADDTRCLGHTGPGGTQVPGTGAQMTLELDSSPWTAEWPEGPSRPMCPRCWATGGGREPTAPARLVLSRGWSPQGTGASAGSRAHPQSLIRRTLHPASGDSGGLGVAEGHVTSPEHWVEGPQGWPPSHKADEIPSPGREPSPVVWRTAWVFLGEDVRGEAVGRGCGSCPVELPPSRPPISPPSLRLSPCLSLRLSPSLSISLSLPCSLRRLKPKSTTWRPGRRRGHGQGAPTLSTLCAARYPALTCLPCSAPCAGWRRTCVAPGRTRVRLLPLSLWTTRDLETGVQRLRQRTPGVTTCAAWVPPPLRAQALGLSVSRPGHLWDLPAVTSPLTLRKTQGTLLLGQPDAHTGPCSLCPP